jgi:hypothetical protein
MGGKAATRQALLRVAAASGCNVVLCWLPQQLLHHQILSHVPRFHASGGNIQLHVMGTVMPSIGQIKSLTEVIYKAVAGK